VGDNLANDTNKIIVDNKALLQQVKKFMSVYAGQEICQVILAPKGESLFESYKIEKEIEKTFKRKVYLPNGAHIVIEQTEGLVAIDVNSGRFTKKTDMEATAFKTNCDAAREIARQIRLRDVGGIIVIDFIDMERSENRKKVHAVLEEGVKRDRAKTRVLQISKLGVAEMTRQRIRDSVVTSVYDKCPYCDGRGLVKSVVTMSLEVIREIRKVASQKRRKKTIRITVNADVAQRLREQEKDVMKKIGQEYGARIHIDADQQLHVEDFSVDY